MFRPQKIPVICIHTLTLRQHVSKTTYVMKQKRIRELHRHHVCEANI